MTLASLCYGALRFSGVTTVARRLARGGVVLCYHNVTAEARPGTETGLGLHMPLGTFARQMRWLADHYTVLPLEEFVARALRGAPLRGAAALTFDDGYAGVFHHAWPLLQELQLPATVFVVAGTPERADRFWWDDPAVARAHTPERQQHWLTASQGDATKILDAPSQAPAWCRPASWSTIAAAAAAGMHIGAHSATHRSLPTLSDTELQREIVDSRDVIRQRTGTSPLFFAYPYGLWNERVRHVVQAAGYRAAFTLAASGGGPRKRDAWSLPRMNIPAAIGDAAFQAWAAGLALRRT